MADIEKLQILLDCLRECDASERLIVHRQNPANHYCWTKPVGYMVTAAEMQVAIEIAVSVLQATAHLTTDKRGAV